MKKILLNILILTGLLMGCSNHETFEYANQNDFSIIKFISLRDKIINKSASDNGHPYAVYSFIDGDANWYMENVAVTNDDVIENNQIYYWPRYDTLSFFAYCPIGDGSISGVQTKVNPPSITMFYEPRGQGTDFTIATSVKQAREKGVNNVTVPLQFQHKLAKIDVTITLSQALVQSNYILNKGTSGSVPEGDTTLYWATITVPYNIGSIDVATETPVWTLTKETATFDRNRTFLILPQTYNETTDSCIIQFKNIILTRNDVVVFQNDLLPYKLKSTDIVNSTFEMGHHYIINFTLNTTSEDENGNPLFGEAMIFGSSIVNWSDSTDMSIVQP